MKTLAKHPSTGVNADGGLFVAIERGRVNDIQNIVRALSTVAWEKANV